MQLTAGTRLGRYRIESLVGSGGMGEVYRAHDSVLDRAVALKVLPVELTANASRVQRFRREAKAASALTHPNILTIHDIGNAVPESGDGSKATDALHYISMELIDGETLRTELVQETSFARKLEWLIQVAEGLAKAHDAGIVHRDLKPENIMISRDGYAKILDFGLAKLVERDGPGADESAATTTHLRTEDGRILGTPGYMSPEQVEGKPVDLRSDLFSFGCLLYEAIMGQRAFQGTSQVDVLHKIVHDEPKPIENVTSEARMDLRRIVSKCLAKDLDERYQSTRELVIDLRHARRLGSAEEDRPVFDPLSKRFVGVAMAMLLGVVVIVLIVRTPRASIEPDTVTSEHGQTPFEAIDIEQVTFSGRVDAVAISPSGRYLAFSREADLVLKQLTTGDERILSAEGPRSSGMVFSPDEDFLYVRARERPESDWSIYRFSVIGGSPVKVADRVSGGPTLSPDGSQFAFVRQEERGYALVVATSGGTREEILLTQEDLISMPAWSPLDHTIIFITSVVPVGPSLARIDTRDRKVDVLKEFWGVPAWMPAGNALVVPRVWPEPKQQIRYVEYPSLRQHRITTDLNDYIDASVTADGRTIASVQMRRSSSLWLGFSGSSTNLEPLTPDAAGKHDFDPDWSHGERIAYVSLDREFHLRIIDPTGGSQPLTLVTEPYSRFYISSVPAISTSEKAVAFTSAVDGSIWLVDLDDRRRRRVTTGSADLNPDWIGESSIVYDAWQRDADNAITGRGELRIVSLASGVSTKIEGSDECSSPRVSPDMKWIAARCGGRNSEMRLFAIDGPEQRTIEMPGDFRLHSWSHAADAILFENSEDEVWRRTLDGGLAEKVLELPDDARGFAFSPDGSRIVVSRSSSSSDAVLIRDHGPSR